MRRDKHISSSSSCTLHFDTKIYLKIEFKNVAFESELLQFDFLGQAFNHIAYHFLHHLVDIGVPYAAVLYPLCFQGVEKGCIENEWVHPFYATGLFLYTLENIENRRSCSDVFRGYGKRPMT